MTQLYKRSAVCNLAFFKGVLLTHVAPVQVHTRTLVVLYQENELVRVSATKRATLRF